MITVPYMPSLGIGFATSSTVSGAYRSISSSSLLRAGENPFTRIASDIIFPSAQRALRDLFLVDPVFSQFVQELIQLRIKDEDEPEEDLPATSFSVTQAFYLTPQSRLSLAQEWAAPALASDGYGGLRMSWSRGGSEVRVSVPATSAGKRRLYWERGDVYGSVTDVTPVTLTKYLQWMINGASSVAE